jgi:hypothetical protein
MKKQLKTFEVIQIIPSVTFVTYHVQAEDADEAESLVDNQDESIERIGEHTEDMIHETIEYDVNELIYENEYHRASI